MQNFTGSHKKAIAGRGYALGILLFCVSISAFANDASTATQSPTVAATNATAETPSTNSVETSAAIITIPVQNSPVTAPKPIGSQQKINSSSQLANLIGGLALILVLIYGLSWFVKRFTQGGFMHNPTMKIVSAMPLGTRERLMLVDVGGKQLLIGVTATQINTLHVFDEPVVNAEKSQSEKTQPAASEFSQKLMAILQQKNFTSPDDDSHKKSNS
ncbi:MAG: flagellar biosynthetic protein FliO [Gammaproteobacteria bacterium]|nr:MAG: flagellar biosynthetic protein FliO [Gammaproteobacteria bacterium]